MRLRLQFSHGFCDTVNPMCACGTEIKTTEHFFLHCHLYSTQILELFESLKKVDSNFLNVNEKGQVKLYCMVLKQMLLNVLIKKFLNL